jgi:regulator of protease activity HflC (stomatin/prohibitin superfamily)
MELAKFAKGLIAAIVGVLFIALGIIICSVNIDPGHAGLVYNMNGGLEKTTLSQGWHPVAPWKSVKQYPVSTETVWLSKAGNEGSKNDDSYNTSTMEGKPVNVDAYYTYHITVEKLPDVFNKFKGADTKTIEDGYLRQQVKSISQAVTSSYSVLDLYGNKRGEIQSKIQDNLVKELEPFGIDIENFSFGEIRPDDDTMKAIQAKVDAQQKLQQMQIELDQAKITADKARTEAQGIADAAVIKATGEANANAKLQASITPELIQYQAVLHWDGQLSKVMGGNSINNLPQDIFEPKK